MVGCATSGELCQKFLIQIMQTKITLLLFSVLILASCGKLDEVVQNDAAPRRAEGDTQPEQYQARGEAMPLTREAIASVLEAFQEPTVRQGMLIQEISAAYQGLDDSKTKNLGELKLADLSKVNRDLFKQCLVVPFTECGYDTDASVALLFGSEVDFKPDDFYYLGGSPVWSFSRTGWARTRITSPIGPDPKIRCP